MKLGAEPKKVGILALLLVVAGYLMYSNLFTSEPPGPPPNARKSASPPPTRSGGAIARNLSGAGAMEVAQQAAPSTAPRNASSRARRGGVQDWNPNLKPAAKPEDRPDPTKVDPTLRLDLLAKLQNVTYSGRGDRSLFDFATAPPPKPLTVPDVKIKPKPGAPAVAGAKPEGPKPPEAKPGTPAAPKAPPVPLKFYGFIAGRDGKRAFFLNGDEIFTAGEGQTLQSRYKIVRIGLNSAVVEDTQFGQQQTVPLEEPPAGT